MTTKTFLLGVGCQKGGTTWVHDHLSRHPQCALGIAKEYHTFDVVASKQQRHLLTRTMKRLVQNLEQAATAIHDGDAVPLDGSVALLTDESLYDNLMRNMRKVGFAFDHSDYVNYFSELARAREIRVTGDITPEYAILTVEDFMNIRRMIEARGDLKIKVIFMMRDPIERIFSSEKMNWRRRGKSEERAAISTIKRYKMPANAPKSRYETTIANIEQVFEPENIQYLFYEELFRQKDVSALYDFLEIDRIIEPDFGHNPLPSGTVKRTLPTDGVAEMRDYFTPTYDFVADRFGVDRISKIWKHY